MPASFVDAIRKAIHDDHPLASELYWSWLDILGDHGAAEFMVCQQLWAHAYDMEHARAS